MKKNLLTVLLMVIMAIAISGQTTAATPKLKIRACILKIIAHLKEKCGNKDTKPEVPEEPGETVGNVLISFPGIEGVTVWYKPTAGPWAQVEDVFNDYANFDLPEDDDYLFVVTNGPMRRESELIQAEDGEFIWNVPLNTVTVKNVGFECAVGVWVEGGWVLNVPGGVLPGEEREFKYFTNDDAQTFLIRHHLAGNNYAYTEEFTGDGYDFDGADDNEYFYSHEIPEGIDNVWIAENEALGFGWLNVVQYGDQVIFLKTLQDVELYYVKDGVATYKMYNFDGSDPFADDEPEVKYVTVSFEGFEGVIVRYYANGWTTVEEDAEDSAEFEFVEGITGIQVTKDGMSIDIPFEEGKFEYTVPVLMLNAYGVNGACSLQVAVQPGSWIGPARDVPGGQSNYFKVFDNGGIYSVTVKAPKFSPITVTATAAVAGPNNPNCENWQLQAYFNGPFYNITVPSGVSNVAIYDKGWIYAQGGDKVLLLKNNEEAFLEFELGGTKFTTTFRLDGTNPFLVRSMAVVNFPGIEGIQMQYYVNGVWQAAFGNFQDTTGVIDIPNGTTSLRAVKGSMYYQIDGLKGQVYPHVFDMPVKTIEVTGINQAGQLAVVQGGWVYNYAPATVGTANNFNVFDNGRAYEVRYLPAGGTVRSLVTTGTSVNFD